jgi:2-(1,2-epoxy-1,2-dihydrophenyl)acetyl-CoA isomerase
MESVMVSVETVLYDAADWIATIHLNRPQVHNALDAAIRRDLHVAIHHANADPAIRLVVLTGAGQSFCAGADLTEKLPADFLVQQQIDDEYKPILTAITESPKLYISAVNGAAAGIGCALAMACDLTVMATDAYYLQAFINIGLIPDGGMSWHLLHQLGRKRAFEFIVSGKKMPAAICLELGLVNRTASADRVLQEATQWAKELASKAPLALRYAKQALGAAQLRGLAESISYEATLQNLTVRSRDFDEGRRSFLEKRAPRFTGQ